MAQTMICKKELVTSVRIFAFSILCLTGEFMVITFAGAAGACFGCVCVCCCGASISLRCRWGDVSDPFCCSGGTVRTVAAGGWAIAAIVVGWISEALLGSSLLGSGSLGSGSLDCLAVGTARIHVATFLPTATQIGAVRDTPAHPS